MPHNEDDGLRALQEDFYRGKVMRARAMTADQRFEEGLELTNDVFKRMLEGAMWQSGLEDEAQGWTEVRRRLERLRRAQEYRLFTNESPPAET